jgi:hypothetical protein
MKMNLLKPLNKWFHSWLALLKVDFIEIDILLVFYQNQFSMLNFFYEIYSTEFTFTKTNLYYWFTLCIFWIDFFGGLG